jgi:hypothetical protein
MPAVLPTPSSQQNVKPEMGSSSPEMGDLTDHPNSAPLFEQLYSQAKQQPDVHCLVANAVSEIQSATL